LILLGTGDKRVMSCMCRWHCR